MSATATPRRPASTGRPARPPSGRRLALALIMGFEALTLAVFSTLHLSGALRIGSGTSDGAGIPEALICIALAGGAWALSRSPVRGRRIALSALAFAILGFIVGLTFTARGGHPIDLIYHVTMLPILIGTAAALARTR